MDRLLVVRCPALVVEDEGGAALRTFAQVLTAVEAYCPWVTPVRPGICSLPARGPARYFGGEDALVDLVHEAASGVAPAEVGIADGLFAAVLAAGRGEVVPAGGTRAFLAPLPVDILGRSELAELLDRLGIRTLGEFAALPDADILGRFGADGAHGHPVAAAASWPTSASPTSPGCWRATALPTHTGWPRSGSGEGSATPTPGPPAAWPSPRSSWARTGW